MIFRDYDKEKDSESAFRVWEECGWLKDNKNDRKMFELFLDSGRTCVVDSKGSAEAVIITHPGKMRYQNSDLKLTAVSGVTVSRVLRKQGAAPRLLASMLAEEMKKGTHLAGLGMFEQGFYNRLGFGTMNYEHIYTFDPLHLKVYKKGGVPVRLTCKDWKECYRCHIERQQGHGFITIPSKKSFRARMMEGNTFGLGFERKGKLSHYIWFDGSGGEQGPYRVRWMAYKNWDEFLELMGILKSLEEQVRSISLREPAHIQLQDFFEKPFQKNAQSAGGKFPTNNKARAYQQLRICHVESCLKAVEYSGKPFSFNLTLSDPILDYLDEKDFTGSAGNYTVTIGSSSGAVRGHGKNLPLVKGSVNGFTRLWIGVKPASTLGLTEELAIPQELIEPLEAAFYKPWARSDWNY
ncbi:MAG: GNAT family N-acetyltransferase [Spirochaetales bacterium]|nr:GNAT family N-acetyltransferase [Spirochaetales bacterium]